MTIPGGGQVVLLGIGSADRDPARFADPDQVDLDRDTTGHLAFGHGTHYCLGAPLARAVGTIAFRSLLERCADLRLTVDPTDIEWQVNPHTRGPVSLPIAFTPIPHR